jgi:peptidoglycan/xylan/chitin deacetylase (PgdA/CDA1 family)
LENGAPSTFFVIPFKGRPGKTREGTAPSFRASGYGAAEVAAQVRNLRSAGCEIGLHGIDAWLDSSSGREELQEIRKLTGERPLGVRMHWLYFDQQSPAALEQAGAVYDSTVGYNETIGFRAGTTQAYRPLDATQLLELPMHIMDTALFYPSYLNLSPAGATQQVAPMIAHAAQSGGAITVNWHDRSIAPERLWGKFYVDLINELKRQGAWFATMGEAAAWFRMRRSATFEVDKSGTACVKFEHGTGANLPGLCSRIHQAQGANQCGAIAAR